MIEGQQWGRDADVVHYNSPVGPPSIHVSTGQDIPTAVPIVPAYIPDARWETPDPSIGGVPGPADRLGYSTGLQSHASRVAPFTGRTIVAPVTQALPNIGPVGRDNRSGNLAAAVKQQSTDYLASSQDMARAFVSGRSIASIHRGFGAQGAGGGE